MATFHELIHKSHIRADRIVVIPNGVDTQEFSPVHNHAELRDSLGLSPDTLVWVSVGRIHAQKNYPVTLAALRLFREKYKTPVKLFIVGRKQDKKLLASLEHFLIDHHLSDACQFVDPSLDIRLYYHIADIVILSSLWEGLPNVVLEAMACGRIVAVSKRADRDNLITHLQTGFLFDPSSPVDLVDQVAHIMALPSNARMEIGFRARQSVDNRFSLSAMVGAFETLYRSTVQT